jgi:hypothetical protein
VFPVASAFRTYAIHGLTIRVDADLPGARAARANASPDIVVHIGAHPAWHDAPSQPGRILFSADPLDSDPAVREVAWVGGGAGLRIRYGEGATFWVSAALDELWGSFPAPLDAADAAYFLFEPVLAFVLRLRGVLALHASAVSIAGRAVLFCGGTGSGKSMTAAAFLARGHALIGDDVVALDGRPSGWVAQPGTTAVRLWDDGARAIVGDADALPVVSASWPKRTFGGGVMRSPVADTAVPVRLICVMDEREVTDRAPRLESIDGSTALRALLLHTAANYLHDADRRAVELRQLGVLVEHVPVVRVTPHTDAARLSDLAAAIEDWVGG